MQSLTIVRMSVALTIGAVGLLAAPQEKRAEPPSLVGAWTLNKEASDAPAARDGVLAARAAVAAPAAAAGTAAVAADSVEADSEVADALDVGATTRRRRAGCRRCATSWKPRSS